MFAAAKLHEFYGRQCLAPCPEHLLFHAIVHGIDWSPHPSYQWLVDTTKILRRAGGGFDWDRLADVARRYHYRFLISSALAEAGRRTGVRVPDGARRRLHAGLAPIERREARLRRLKPSSLSSGDELILALQKFRRGRVKDPDPIALRAASRLAKSLLGSLSGDRSFILGDRGDRITLLHGWSAPDATGRWTEGRFVSIAIFAPERPRPTALKLRAHPLRGPNTGVQEVDIFARLSRLAVLTWSASGPDPHAQQLLLPTRIWRGDTAVLRFEIGSRGSPLELEMGGDARALGIFVEEISVDPPVRDLRGDPLDLSAQGRDRDALWHGWSVPEPEGCWTFGRLSTIRWRSPTAIQGRDALLVEVAMVAPSRGEIRGRFRLNQQCVGSFRFPAMTQLAGILRLPLTNAVAAGSVIELAIEVDDPQSPADAIGAADRRPLGLMIRRVWIDRIAAS
jgi:hypothetical protein